MKSWEKTEELRIDKKILNRITDGRRISYVLCGTERYRWNQMVKREGGRQWVK